MQLPRVGCQVERVVLCPLAEPSVSGWESCGQIHRLSVGEDWAYDVTADGHAGGRGTGDEATVHLLGA